MSRDDQHAAFPRLTGAPAYSRPRQPAEASPRPFDPDDLPLAHARAEDDGAGDPGTEAAPAPARAATSTLAGTPLGALARRIRRAGG